MVYKVTLFCRNWQFSGACFLKTHEFYVEVDDSYLEEAIKGEIRRLSAHAEGYFAYTAVGVNVVRLERKV